MQPDDLLTLAQLLKAHLSSIQQSGSISAKELNEVVEYCETLVQELESLSFEAESRVKPAKARRRQKAGR